MEGMEIESREHQHMHQRRRCVQLSEDERRERREQQRLWYRRRRSQMTDQEIAFHNERRRLRYRLRRLQANTEQITGEVRGIPVPHAQGGSAQANGYKVPGEAEENERREQQGICEWGTWMTSPPVDSQGQQRLNHGQQMWQVSGEGVRENGVQQQQWRWKVEARKGRADTEAQPADLNVVVRDVYGTNRVDGHSDDSETTETDESLQDMRPGRHGGAIVKASRRPSIDDLQSVDEVTSKALSFEGIIHLHQPATLQAGCVPKRIRLTEIKRLAREMHNNLAS